MMPPHWEHFKDYSYEHLGTHFCFQAGLGEVGLLPFDVFLLKGFCFQG